MLRKLLATAALTTASVVATVTVAPAGYAADSPASPIATVVAHVAPILAGPSAVTVRNDVTLLLQNDNYSAPTSTIVQVLNRASPPSRARSIGPWQSLRAMYAENVPPLEMVGTPAQLVSLNAWQAFIEGSDWSTYRRDMLAALSTPSALAAENAFDARPDAALLFPGSGLLSDTAGLVSDAAGAVADTATYAAKTVGNVLVVGAVETGALLSFAACEPFGAAAGAIVGGAVAAEPGVIVGAAVGGAALGAACATVFLNTGAGGQALGAADAIVSDTRQFFLGTAPRDAAATGGDVITDVIVTEIEGILCANAVGQATQNPPAYEQGLIYEYCVRQPTS